MLLLNHKLAPPCNYQAQDASIFEVEKGFDYPSPNTKIVSHARYEGNGILYKWGFLYTTSYLEYTSKSWYAATKNLIWPRPWRYCKFLYRHYIKVKEQAHLSEAILFCHRYATNYYHWMIDCLPRFIVAKEAGWSETIIIPEDTWSPFMKDSLEVLGIKNYLPIKHDFYARIDRLNIVSPLHYEFAVHPLYLQKLKNLFFNALKIQEPLRANRYIYISRNKAPKRRLVNENDVVVLMEKYGFEVVYTEDLSIEERVRLFSNTACVVAQHGAGLANMLFMPQGARVLEIGLRGVTSKHFYVLANVLGLKYYYSFDTTRQENPDHQIFNQDITVNMPALEKTLIQLMEGV